MLPEELLAKVARALEAVTGLHFPPGRRRQLKQGLAETARAVGEAGPVELAQRILAGPGERKLLDLLASRLTIGETYFFRDAAMLAALEQRILPELIARHERSDRSLRIWSAGCCTGEEPYTIAMILDRLLPDQRSWKITILGTDLNRAYLQQAAAAVYGRWSFRGVPAALQRTYFRVRSDGRFELEPRIRERVTFRKLNLAVDPYPGERDGGGPLDLVLCRNVLMYMKAERSDSIVARFRRSLAEGGWFVTSAAEAAGRVYPGFEATSQPGALLFQARGDGSAGQAPFGVRQGAARGPASLPSQAPGRAPRTARLRPTAPPAKPLPRPSSAPGARRAPAEATAAASAPSMLLAESAQKAPGATAGELIRQARAAADAGRHDEAVETARRAIVADSDSAAHRYLLAVIELERGRVEEAGTALTQALYLDPTLPLAHVALGHVRAGQSRHAEARRHFDNALGLLRALPTDEEVPESDGLTAGRLAAMVTSAREGVGSAAVTGSGQGETAA